MFCEIRITTSNKCAWIRKRQTNVVNRVYNRPNPRRLSTVDLIHVGIRMVFLTLPIHLIKFEASYLKNRPLESVTGSMRIFWCHGIFFSWISILRMGVKMNLRMITKLYTTDPEIGFLKNRFESCMAAQWPCRQRWS